MPFKKPPYTARNVMLGLLARRDHSAKELVQKLKIREFPSEEIIKALEYAEEHQLIAESAKLAEGFAQALHRRKKGIKKINSILTQKGLPLVKSDSELEYEKALALAKSKLKIKKYMPLTDIKVRARLGRFLQSRGFTNEIVNKVLAQVR